MKQKLFTLLLALIGLTTTVWAEDYGIKIGGVAVTSDNYTNITSSNFPAVTSGYVTYDPSTRTLTLIYANIAGTISFLNNSAGFTLSLTKNTVNVVSGNSNNALYVDRVPLTISGGGTLMVSSNTTNCIYLNYNASNDYTLSIENSTVIASGTAAGIWCPSTYGTLNIDNSTVMATGLQGGSVRGMKAVTLTNAWLCQPDGATWSETAHAVCDSEGTIVASTVMFAPITGSGQGDSNNTFVGDVDGSGSLTLADVTALVNMIVHGIQQPVTRIILSSTSITMNNGDTHQLTAMVSPSNANNKNLYWSSSNSAVATVSSTGLVTGVRGGTCTITCVATDGSGKKATCAVRVKQPVTDITLSATNVGIYNGDTYQLTATVSPSNADNQNVNWSSSNTSVATVSSTGLVTAVNVGNCIITCSATDDSGVSTTCAVTVWPVSGTIGGHAYVDLGLPSGTLWATMNVGATSPEGYGDYFAWGETVPYGGTDMSNHTNYAYSGSYTRDYYSWETYKWCDGSQSSLRKYCTKSDYGNVDNILELQLGDDAAYMNWDSNWRMPSMDQLNELVNGNYTTQVWTSVNGVYGIKITSVQSGYTDKSIFLPASGYRHYNSTYGSEGEFLFYWSRRLHNLYPYGGLIMRCVKGHFSPSSYEFRDFGLPIRPVRNQ